MHTSVAEFAAHVAGLDDYVAYAYNATIPYATKIAYLVGTNLSNGTGENKKYYVVTSAITASENTSFDAISEKVSEVTGNKYAQNSLIVNLAAHDHKIYKATADITYAENTSFEAISAKLEEQTGEFKAAVQYKLYGDFTYTTQTAQGITEENATWKQLVYVSGQAYMLIPDGVTPATESSEKMFCTSGDGIKNIYLKVKDNAENVSSAVMQSFFYDTTAPVVVVSGVDYNRISKVHTERLTVDGTVKPVSPTKYNDETKFTFTPDTVIQAYKVVAYVSQAAAVAGSAADEPIKQAGDSKAKETDPTPASINMHATGLSSDAAVNATIKGADYETRLLVAYDSNAMTQAEAEAAGFTFEDGEVNGIDGAHYVVVYVQDLAGTWSVAAEFTA